MRGHELRTVEQSMKSCSPHQISIEAQFGALIVGAPLTCQACGGQYRAVRSARATTLAILLIPVALAVAVGGMGMIVSTIICAGVLAPILASGLPLEG